MLLAGLLALSSLLCSLVNVMPSEAPPVGESHAGPTRSPAVSAELEGTSMCDPLRTHCSKESNCVYPTYSKCCCRCVDPAPPTAYPLAPEEQGRCDPLGPDCTQDSDCGQHEPLTMCCCSCFFSGDATTQGPA